MAAEIRMPQFGVSMETGTIAQWCKAEGDPVKVGDVLASIETEKLTNDVISEVDGVLLKIVAPEGDGRPRAGAGGLCRPARRGSPRRDRRGRPPHPPLGTLPPCRALKRPSRPSDGSRRPRWRAKSP